ncbi:MAG: 1-deoxy-D-xylulose-5-phosphate reductoisomerase [Clostridia bacterium]|nr:1-deoxy-D-xylulose-5-phosphate reductoisomerase [Clostridia bacterium]
MKKIALIGSTGSIGVQSLNVVRNNPDKFEIVSLAGGNSRERFLEQVKEFKPKVATLINECNVAEYKGTDFYFGEQSFTNAITEDADIVVVSLVGFTGIIAVLDAIKKGKNVALANKESLVVGGELVMKLAKEKGITITPIDSEHSAIWQALNFDFNTPFNKIILTASGGAFRDFNPNELANVTAKDALKHPNWAMGNKITVDCATMVNKAFEVIEAKWLYNTNFDKIDVIIHRESIIHSMVEFVDNSVIAQLSNPSMELPIQIALSYPERFTSSVKPLDFKTIKNLSFEEVDNAKYPCFNLVRECARKGGIYTALINGANDMAVELFLKDKIKYSDIEKALDLAVSTYNGSYDGTFESLKTANDYAVNLVKTKFGV